MVFSNNLLAGSGGQSTGYEIDQSIRFNEDDSAHLDRTPSSESNRNTFTFSVWIKRGRLTSHGNILSAGSNSNDFTFLSFINDQIVFADWNGSYAWQLVSTAVFRDPASWYNIVAKYDDTQSTASNRVEIYVNGSKITAYDTESYPSQNYNNTEINSTDEHTIGKQTAGSGANDLFDGYMAEIVLVDGTALDASSFGETNSDTGQWVPKDVSGLTFGTNGFHITGADSTALGEDVRISGDQVISYAASQYTGATGSYTYSNGRLEADTDNKAIRTADTFAGDFEFSWRYNTMANFVIGVYETGEDGTFSDSSSVGNMQNMTASWYLQTSSVAANRDIFYGGAVQVNATTIADGDTWKMTRSSGTIKLIRNGSDVHTFSQTSTNTVRIVIAQGDASADVGQVVWVDNSTLGNNFFSSGLATADQVTDTPTNNFCTLNPIETTWGAAVTLSDGNLAIAGTAATVWNNAVATFKTLPSTGKWIWAAEPNTSGGGHCDPWIVNETGLASRNNYVYVDANGWETTFDSSSVHTVLNNGAGRNASFTYGSGDFHVICFDADSKKLWFGVYDVSAGTLQFHDGSTGLTGDPAAGTNQTYTLTGNEFSIGFATYTGRGGNVDFGQSDLLSQITVPSGFNFLNTENLPDPAIADPSKYFQSVEYATTTSAQDITFGGNSDLAPDWLWFKRRDHASDHFLFDKVRGVLKTISSNDTNPEVTSAGSLTAFGTDGFSLGDGGSDNDINGASSSGNFMAWGWAAGGTSGSSNSDGSVTSTVSANTTAGFSICKLNPGGNNNITFGHGLGVAPRLVIVKNLEDATNWQVLHLDQGVGNKIFLNSSNAAASDANMWQNTAPTSTVVSMGTAQTTNEDVIAYCFAEISGYSKISNYVGNGDANGPFVNCGFKPAWVIGKRIGGSGGYFDWFLFDSESPGFNVTNERIHPNNVQATDTGAGSLDLVSNGFKIRTNTSSMNSSGDTIIFMAFAESPFKTATAR